MKILSVRPLLDIIAMETEKHGVVHAEAATHGNDVQLEKQAVTNSERVPEALGREASELPKGYFYSLMFVGSYTAIGKYLFSVYEAG